MLRKLNLKHSDILQELKNRKLAPEKGFHLYFSSSLPIAVGLSSSAALELATALTLLQLAKKELPRHELVSLCRDAENKFVGMPCGILDQGTSAFGENNSLVKIDCAAVVGEALLKIKPCIKTCRAMVIQKAIANKLLYIDARSKSVIALFVVEL